MIDRNLFLPESLRNVPDVNTALAMPSADYSISQTKTVDLMLKALDVKPGMRVCEVGAGTGYHAARLAELGAEVFSIERLSHGVEFARSNLLSAEKSSVTVIEGDGFLGAPAHAPFDRITISCAVGAFPRSLFEQLRVGGIMIYPACIAGTEPGVVPDILIKIEKKSDLPQQHDRDIVDACMNIKQLDAVYFMRGVSELLPATIQSTELGYGRSYDVERNRPEIGFVDISYKKEDGPPLHYHRFEDERFQVMEGSFEFRLGDERFHLTKGQSCIANRETPHKFRATGDGDNRLFLSLTPGGSERYFSEMADYWQRPNPSYKVAGTINAKYGMVLLESSEDARKHF